MSDTKEIKYNSRIGFPGLLTILFIGLKLTDNIDWSWWWVLSPIWIPLVVVLGFFTIVVSIALLANIILQILK